MKNQILRITGGAAILLLSVTALYFYGANKASHKDLILLKGEKKAIELSIAKITEEKRYAEEKLADISAKNDEAMERISGYSARVEAMTSEYKARMESFAAERDKLNLNIAALNREISEKNSETRLLKKSLKKIDKKLKEAKTGKSVNLDPIVVARAKNAPGRILEVNSDYEFVIVDLGSDDGIAAGDTLFVFRKKSMLGRIVVEETQKKYCAAKILYKSLGDVVQKGDSVNIP